MAVLAAWTLSAALATSPTLIYNLPPPQLKTYPVYGQGFEELLEDCRERGPADPEGRRFPGFTRYAYRYQYHYDYKVEDRLAIIRLTDLTVDWSHEVTLPTLAPGIRLSPSDSARWRQFLDQLQAHENVHLEISTDPRLKSHFQAIAQSARVLYKPLGPTGSVSEEAIKAVVDRAIQPGILRIAAHIARKNREFDQATEHGTQPMGFDRARFFSELWEGL